MKEIPHYNFHNARLAEHFYFHDTVLEILTEELAEAYGFASQRANYVAQYRRQRKAHHASRGYAQTAQIVKADKRRDGCVIYLHRTVNAGRYSPIKEERDAAEKMYFELKPFRRTARKSYRENSAEISKLLQVLRQPEIARALEVLGLTDIADRLEAADAAFDALYDERMKEHYDRYEDVKMRVIRPIVDDAFRDCAATLNALFRVNELVQKDETVRAELGGVIDRIHAAILQLRETVSLRTARSRGKREREEESQNEND